MKEGGLELEKGEDAFLLFPLSFEQLGWEMIMLVNWKMTLIFEN